MIETERLLLRKPRPGDDPPAAFLNLRSSRVAEKLGATPERVVETELGPAVIWVHP